MSGRGIKKQSKILSKSAKAGLIFPVARFHRYLKKQFSTSSQFKISGGAAVYAASVLEYLVAEITEQAGNAAKVLKVKRITPRHIMLAIHQDLEMHQTLKHVILPSSGRPLNLLFKSPAETAKAKKQQKAVVSTNNKQAVKSTKTTAKKPGSCVHQKAKKVITKSKNVTWECVHQKAKKVAKKMTKKEKIQKSAASKKTVEVLNQRYLFLGQKLAVVQGDIVDVTAEAVVHPTSSNYGFGGEVGSALKRKGGQALENEVNKTRAVTPNIKLCEGVVSGAANLSYKHIIHVHSPSWQTGGNSNQAISNLEKTIRNILDLADSNGITSVAIPSISSGGNGYPKQIAAETILQTINSYFAGVQKSGIQLIYFVIFDKETLDVYNAELTRLA